MGLLDHQNGSLLSDSWSGAHTSVADAAGLDAVPDPTPSAPFCAASIASAFGNDAAVAAPTDARPHRPTWADSSAADLAGTPDDGDFRTFGSLPAGGRSGAPPQAAVPSPGADATDVPPASATASLVSSASRAAIDANAASSLYGVSGAGVKIGIISDSFNALGGAAADEADGALPTSSNVKVLKDYAGGTDEGRAMAQIVHSVAPGAQIDFYSGQYGQADMAAGIAALQADGCQIIVDDLTYLAEPFYQMGDPIERAIQSFVAGGGTYFTAAGNAGPQAFYENTWQPTQANLPGIGVVTAMNFGTSEAPSYNEAVHLTAGAPTIFDLQWAQPWQSIDGTGSSYSLGFALYDPNGNLVAHFSRDVTGGDPIQLGIVDPKMSGTYSLAIYVNGGTDPGGQFKIIGDNNSRPSVSFANASGSGSVFGHNMDPYAITVGADYYGNSSAYGRTPRSESFSAAGPGELLYGPQGGRFAHPKWLDKVNVSGPDGQTTTDPLVSPFFGTSAATPAVAAAAALMLQADPSLTSAQIKSILETSATAFGASDQAGAGLVQTQAAVALAQQDTTSGISQSSLSTTSALHWSSGMTSPSVLRAGAASISGTAGRNIDLATAAHGVGEGQGNSNLLWTGNAGGGAATASQPLASVAAPQSVQDSHDLLYATARHGWTAPASSMLARSSISDARGMLHIIT